MALVTSRRLNAVFKFAAIFFLAIGLLAFQNCSKAKFGATSSSSLVDGFGELVHVPGSCHETLQRITIPIKVLFVVDTSGSNFENNNQPGSDPVRRVRGDSIQTFFNDYKTKSNFGWGFEEFHGFRAHAYINNGSSSSGRFSVDTADMAAALVEFGASSDGGYTPYKAALDMAKQTIQSDMAADPATKYLVVFLSDGMPTDYPSDSAGQMQLESDVQALTNIYPGRISFNAIYYGEDDASASERMHGMAVAGGGEFLDTNKNPNGKSFYIDDYVMIPGVVCQ